jgi:putative ABC transport system permease protein
MATASQALNDELPPRARLMGLAAALQAELAKPGLSDQFRSLLADDELRAWLEPLAFADHDRLTLANELATLSRLQVIDVKARVLAKAESDGSQFMLIFLIMGTFSIMVGMLLVFLLFVMLAAERQSEMGMARAVGLQRGHLIQMFLTEGMVYELIAGVIGVALGIGLSRLMVVFLAEAFAQVEDAGFGRQILFQITLPSIVVALCLGLVLTTLTVAFSAWRISRMNIIAAIRNVPADAPQTSWISRLVALSRVALILFLGAGAVAGGYTGKTLPLVYFGLSVIIIGAGLLLAWIAHLTPFHRRTLDRVVYTLAGTALMSLWLVPGMDGLLGISDFAQGPSIFIFSGVFLILGAIWVLMYNLDVLLSAISGSLSRSGRLAPILKMAVAYPLVSKFRTGVAMAMFSLIIFTIVMVSSITSTQDSVYEDLDAFTGGYQVVAQINGDNRIGDLKAAAQQASGVDAAALEMVSGVARQSVEARQVGAQRRVVSALFAPDASYYERVPSHMRLKMRTSEFATDQAVWEAMQTRDDVALLTRLNVRSGTSPNGEPGGAFVLTSTAYIEDSVLPPAEIEMRLPGTEQTRTVKIIGVIDSYAVPMNGIYTNAATMQTLTGRTLAHSLYMINVRAGADATAIAQQLEKAFLTDGLDASALDRQIKSLQEGDKVVFNLFKGFLALGLVIGVAALGVISSRNVIERRQQIGMLRAIGFNSNMVQLSFMVEASIIALLGLFLGSTLGLVLGANITADIARGQPGVTFNPEWGHLALILAAAYFFSLLTTYLPARRAARIYPAEALRYE